MPTYNKLVRDQIPDIIKKSGQKYTSKVLTEEDYIKEINNKLREELAEYEATTTTADAIEELADILELIHAATSYYNISFEDLEKVRIEKAEKRGGFEERIFLIDVEDS